MTDFQLHFEQQIEQPNGFWLSRWRLDEDSQCPKSIALPFNAAFELNEIWFQLISRQSNGYEFLAQAPLQEPTSQQQIRLKNHQAWRFLPDLVASLDPNHSLLITGSNRAMSTALLLCQQLKEAFDIQVLLHSDNGFPFQVKPARFLWGNAPTEAIGAMPLLEDWKIPNRLCHSPFQPGCFEGTLEDFLKQWTPDPNQQIIDCNDFKI